MSSEAVRALLERRPFVPFVLWLAGEIRVHIRRADDARMDGEDTTLCVVQPRTELVDLSLVERVTFDDGFVARDGSWPV